MGDEREAGALPSPEVPVLDPRVLADLREILDDDVDAIVAEYLRDAQRLAAEAQSALAGGDPTTLRRAAHSLKSASATVGATALSRVCARVEAALRHGDVAAAAPDVPLIADLERRSARAIEALGAGGAGPAPPGPGTQPPT